MRTIVLLVNSLVTKSMFSLKELIEHSFFFKKEWNVIGFRTCEQAENTRTIEGKERHHFVYFCVLYFFIKTIVIYFVIVSIRSDYYKIFKTRWGGGLCGVHRNNRYRMRTRSRIMSPLFFAIKCPFKSAMLNLTRS